MLVDILFCLIAQLWVSWYVGQPMFHLLIVPVYLYMHLDQIMLCGAVVPDLIYTKKLKNLKPTFSTFS